MKKLLFYPRLAAQGLRKNAEMSLPYLLMGMLMVSVSYIMNYITRGNVLSALSMGDTTLIVLTMGKIVVAFFSVLFLYYCNSFLIRRRMKEFGLYNILGMGKRNIACIMLWETLLTALTVLVGGLLLGLCLSRLMEMALLNLVHADYTPPLQLFYRPGVVWVLLLFGGIYLLILLANLLRMRLTNPVALLKSESTGEKPPRANLLVGVAGLVILVAAYVLALYSNSPYLAITYFFIAVLMVILATYLLFVSGSVVLCRILKGRKRYYYKTRHFISVSSMAYRMKRNGAGMATICVLCTMVLVILVSTVCLYGGTTSMVSASCPQDVNVTISLDAKEDTPSNLPIMREAVLDSIRQFGCEPQHVTGYRSLTDTGKISGGNYDIISQSDPLTTQVMELAIYPISLYEEFTGETVTLGEQELLCYPFKTDTCPDSLSFYGGAPYQFRRISTPLPDALLSDDYSSSWPCLILFVADWDAFRADMMIRADDEDAFIYDRLSLHFDLDGTLPEDTTLSRTIYAAIIDTRNQLGYDGRCAYDVNCRSEYLNELYTLFGGLFFLGIILGPLFSLSAMLIMYYKQICEGHEDASRFAVMRKVGLSERDIRQSIRSQVLTVFFAPLALAGLHLAFAMPMVRLILGAFGLHNDTLFFGVALLSFLVFSVVYTLVYAVTARRYYRIVR